MVLYLYKCPTHGVMGIQKPMAEASVVEYCGQCFLANQEATGPDDTYDFRGSTEPMRRVWSVPNVITRPWGYHLDPHHPDYWKLDRMQEMGHVPTPDAKSNLGAGAPTQAQLDAEEYAGVRLPEPSPDELQKVAEITRATFSESGSRL